MLSLKSKYRTHTCGELTEKNVGETVTLSGWVHRKRDHGSLLFVDLRDNYGITQIVFDGGDEALEKVRPESVIQITGNVVARDASQINEKIPTGHIEVKATTWKVLTNADVLPFQVFGILKIPCPTFYHAKTSLHDYESKYCYANFHDANR